jgi:hypothetical protein
MRGKGWLYAATPLIALLTGISFGITTPAAASAPPQPKTGQLKPMAERMTTEQIKDMAAKGSGTMFTVKGTNGQIQGEARAADIYCIIIAGLAYGGGAPDADVAVDGLIACDDYVDIAAIRVELYRDNVRVASTVGAFPFTFGIIATASINDCVDGNYDGVAIGEVVRFDTVNVVASARTRSPFPVGIPCGTPPGPGGPGIPTPPNCQVNPALCARHTPTRPRRRRRPRRPDLNDD